MDWMFELVGTPYKKDGLDPFNGGVDCYGLVRWVLKHGLDLELPEKPMGWRRYGKLIDFSFTDIRPYDVLFFNDEGFGVVTHMGIMASKTEFIHAWGKAKQVVCQPISPYARLVKKVGRATIS